MRTCSRCNKEKSLECYRAVRGDRRRRVCTPCLGKQRVRTPSPEDTARYTATRAAKVSAQRLGGEHVGKFVLLDSRASDRKTKRKNDLDRATVDRLVSQPCSYCGCADLRMTLDRIDNELGHTVSNVVPSCLRCNYIRNSMPWEAWLVVATAVRQAHQLGLFGDWRTVPFNRSAA